MSTSANIFCRHYQFTTPITGGAHEAWPLAGDEDTPLEIVLDTGYAIIIKLENIGDMSENADYQLQYEIDGGGWNDVNAASSNVRTTAAGDADGATSTVERLTAVSEAFGESILDTVDGIQTVGISGHDADEFYFAIAFRSAELSGEESIEFRILIGGADLVTHIVAPIATVPVVVGPDQTADGSPSISPITASGDAEVIRTADGAASISPIIASGDVEVIRKASGAASISPITADGDASIVLDITTADGAASISPITAAGVAEIFRTAQGGPSISKITASGNSFIWPKVWLNTSQTLSGATEMTISSVQADGTGITFDDSVGPPTGSIFLGVENRVNGDVGWIAVTITERTGPVIVFGGFGA